VVEQPSRRKGVHEAAHLPAGIALHFRTPQEITDGSCFGEEEPQNNDL